VFVRAVCVCVCVCGVCDIYVFVMWCYMCSFIFYMWEGFVFIVLMLCVIVFVLSCVHRVKEYLFSPNSVLSSVQPLCNGFSCVFCILQCHVCVVYLYTTTTGTIA
jgi:hypothetical protein